MKNKYIECPLCHYKVLIKKNGEQSIINQIFETIQVSHDYTINYDSTVTYIALCCPKCGILFQNKRQK
jgi:hypothetical protein